MEGKCTSVECERLNKQGNVVLEWRGVKFQKPLCPVCAQREVARMIKNKELEDPLRKVDL